jgi:hypothetical protein
VELGLILAVLAVLDFAQPLQAQGFSTLAVAVAVVMAVLLGLVVLEVAAQALILV